jgi:hypothetical protein
MIVNDLTQLSVVGVYKRGVPNEEYIAIQAQSDINLGQYGIMLGFYADTNAAIPIRDNLFWFGDGIVNSGDWLFINTGPGKPTQTTTLDKNNNIYSLYWDRNVTVFANSNTVPILFKVEAVEVPFPARDIHQIEK